MRRLQSLHGLLLKALSLTHHVEEPLFGRAVFLRLELVEHVGVQSLDDFRQAGCRDGEAADQRDGVFEILRGHGFVWVVGGREFPRASCAARVGGAVGHAPRGCGIGPVRNQGRSGIEDGTAKLVGMRSPERGPRQMSAQAFPAVNVLPTFSPSRSRRLRSVLGCIPARAAAPSGPEIRPRVSLRSASK